MGCTSIYVGKMLGGVETNIDAIGVKSEHDTSPFGQVPVLTESLDAKIKSPTDINSEHDTVAFSVV